MTGLEEKAREVLAGNTGFSDLKVSGLTQGRDFCRVEVEALDGAAGPGGIVRTYEVVFDGAGALHGYALLSYRMPRLRGC
ncbi:MAG TPA: hypothetical protein DDW67_09020 [Elusimicrobia bacterium]|nr:hypothetical protein [Elusimicrobiota bacterium]